MSNGRAFYGECKGGPYNGQMFAGVNSPFNVYLRLDIPLMPHSDNTEIQQDSVYGTYTFIPGHWEWKENKIP